MTDFSNTIRNKNTWVDFENLFEKKPFGVCGCPGCFNARKVVTQIILNKNISEVPGIKIFIVCEFCQKVWNVKE